MPEKSGSAPSRRATQLPLDLDWPRKTALRRSDFVEGACNTQALEMLDFWEHWPERRLMLCGPEGCGKTHLAAIWAAEAGAQFVDPAALTLENYRQVAALERVVLEDVDRVLSHAGAPQPPEQALLYLYNVMAEQGGWLLFTARTPPARWNIALPDLASRLKSVTVFRVGTPDDAVMAQVVLKQFGDRSIAVNPKTAQFIATRLDRRFEAVAAAVERLDQHSVMEKRPITVALVKDVFGW